MKAQRCPICEGRGKVAADFYYDEPAVAPGSTNPRYIQCRTCHGSGLYYYTPDFQEVDAGTPLTPTWIALIGAQNDYMQFLSNEIVRTMPFLCVHGMETPMPIMEEGTRLRERIRSLGGTVPK
jgi:hypothetical protein